MLRSLALLAAFFLIMLAPPARADTAEARLRSTVRAAFGKRLPYYTIVPHKQSYFAVAYNVDANTRNSTGKKTHWAVYEYAQAHWSKVFEFDSTADADEESARLNSIFAKNQFSSDMRTKLMYGQERRI